METITAPEPTSIEGLKYERYIEVEGVTYQCTASGPSFYNGLGTLRLKEVNEQSVISGVIYPSGTISISPVGCWRRPGTGWLWPSPDLFVAFGEMCADEGFRAVVDAVAAR